MTESPPATGRTQASGRLVPALEILAVVAVAALVFAVGAPLAGDNPLAYQAVAWVANVTVLGTIWWMLRRRGRGWQDLGLGAGSWSPRGAWQLVWKSFVVFVAAMFAFLVGAIVMVNIVGRPEAADMSGYNHLSGNLPLLIATLAGVFVASSLGEEVIYRGFLITRLEALGGGGKAALRIAILASATVFGLIHFTWGPMGMVQTAFMGLALAISFVALGRNLWPLVFAHFYLDAILMIQMYLAPASQT